jgi:putative flippase GtrA
VAFNFRRWGVFNLVGMSGFALQLGTIALLTRGLGWSALAATAAGLEIAALNNFIGHNRITWNDNPPRTMREWFGRYLHFQVAKSASLAASLAITLTLTGLGGVPPELANTIAVLICAVPNYLLTERLVFTR